MQLLGELNGRLRCLWACNLVIAVGTTISRILRYYVRVHHLAQQAAKNQGRVTRGNTYANLAGQVRHDVTKVRYFGAGRAVLWFGLLPLPVDLATVLPRL